MAGAWTIIGTTRDGMTVKRGPIDDKHATLIVMEEEDDADRNLAIFAHDAAGLIALLAQAIVDVENDTTRRER